MLHDPLWRAAASLGLVLVSVGMVRMGGKFLADLRDEAFAEDHARARTRFLAWFQLGSALQGALLRAFVVLAAAAVVVRSEPCDLRAFPGVDLFAAVFVAARFVVTGFLVGGVAAALPALVTAFRYAAHNRRAKWGDERATHAVVLSLLAVPLALGLEWLALRIVWGRDCLFDPF